MSLSMFDQARIAIDRYSEEVTNDTIRSNQLTYSDSDIGLRHPDLPVGAIFRDQGQFDIYAGQVRMLGDMSGGLYLLSNSTIVTSKFISFPNTDWFSLPVGNKVFNPKINDDYNVLLIKKDVDISKIYVMDDTTRAIPETGEIINKKPLSNYCNNDTLFVDYDLVDTPEMDHLTYYMENLK
jgi:hypothetical protein